MASDSGSDGSNPERKRPAPIPHIPRKRGPYKKAKLDPLLINAVPIVRDIWNADGTEVGEEGDIECVECDEGGVLYICEKCRLVYHEECLQRYYGGLYQDLHAADEWVCYCCTLRQQQGTERYYRWLLERYKDQLNSPIAALPYLLKELLQHASTPPLMRFTIVIDIPPDRRYPKSQYQSLFKHLGLMSISTSRHAWRFRTSFDLDMFLSVFSARIGRRTLVASDNDPYLTSRSNAKDPSALLQRLIIPLNTLLERSGIKSSIDIVKINFSNVGEGASGVLAGLAPFAEEISVLLPRLDMELRARDDNDLQAIIEVASLWKTLYMDLSALNAALSAYLATFAPPSALSPTSPTSPPASLASSKEFISHALYSALLKPPKPVTSPPPSSATLSPTWGSPTLSTETTVPKIEQYNNLRDQEARCLEELAKVRSKLHDLGYISQQQQLYHQQQQPPPKRGRGRPPANSYSALAPAPATSSFLLPASSTSTSSTITTYVPMPLPPPVSPLSSPSTPPPTSSTVDLDHLEGDPMTMPFVALLRMIEDAIRLLNKEITARLGSALEYTQKEIVKQGWITALASLRREIQYREVADRTDAAAVNSKRLRDYNVIAKDIAQKQVDEIEVARMGVIGKLGRLRDLLPNDQKTQLLPLINIILDLCDSATPSTCLRATRVLYHQKCYAHITRDVDFECAERLSLAVEVANKLANELGADKLVVVPNKNIPDDIDNFIAMAHPVAYIDMIQRMLPLRPNAPPVSLSPHSSAAAYDTCVSFDSLTAARHAAGIVCAAIDMVMTEPRCANVFCAVRPPGHHAGPTGCAMGAASQGFCLLNNIAIGLLYSLGRYGGGVPPSVGAAPVSSTPLRVAIVDFDLHRGNGTEHIITERCNDENVIFISMHLEQTTRGEPFYPYPLKQLNQLNGHNHNHSHNNFNNHSDAMGTSPEDEGLESPPGTPPITPPIYEPLSNTATASPTMAAVPAPVPVPAPAPVAAPVPPPVRKGIVNIPLTAGMSSAQFRLLVNTKVVPALQAFGPTLLLISAGFDLHRDDPLNGGQVGVDEFDIGWLTNRITVICPRAVAVLEGGYGLRNRDNQPGPFVRAMTSTLRGMVDAADDSLAK